jgi:type III pantothenate kinase
MIVAIDAGNTRTKWGVLDSSGAILQQGAVGNSQLHGLTGISDSWRGCRRVVVSNVAGASVASRLQALCGEVSLPQLTVQATATACGVVNGYLQPGQLGSDRWAALVAGWNRHREPCVVVSAGTALTVDALSSRGEFLGGLIVPGWHMMQASLASGAAGLAAAAGDLQHFPVRTADAMCSGAWLAMAGAVEKMHHALQVREGRTPRCLLSGGDAAGLQAALSCPAEMTDNLVLRGLWLIEQEYP